MTNNKKFECELCKVELKPGDYIAKCSVGVCVDLLFCKADHWLAHCMLEHADRYLGFLNEDRSIRREL